MAPFRFSAFLLSCFLSANCAAAQNAAGALLPEIRIGFLSNVSAEVRERNVLPTFEYLQKALKDKYRLKLIYLSGNVIEEDLRTHQAQFLISPSENYLELSTSPQYGAHDIAALKPIFSSSTHKANGALFIARSDRKDLITLKDLKGKSVSALDPDSLIGWWAALGQIQKEGFNPETFFLRKSFNRTSPMEVVEEVLSGHSEVGIIPTCVLEWMEGEGLLARGSVRPVALYTPAAEETSFACKRSTEALYPGLIFSSLSSAPDYIVKDVVKALFSMPPTEANEWVVSGDFTEVMDLMKLLKFGMYEHLRDYSLPSLIRTYWKEISGILLLILVLCLNEVRLRKLVDRRTGELRRALADKISAEKEAVAGRKRLARIERSGVISQMSNIIAHELKQPLGSVLNYAAILKLRLKKDSEADEMTRTVIDNLNSETRRISDIVDSVRKFARREQADPVVCDLKVIVAKAIRSFSHQEDSEIAVPFITSEEKAPILADPLSLELLVLNLIRNAASAAQSSPKPALGVVLSPVGERWQLTVWNNGKVLSDSAFQELSHAAESTKADGLGLGLSIVREIADLHSADLHFEKRKGGGIVATVLIDALLTTSERDEAPGNLQQASRRTLYPAASF